MRKFILAFLLLITTNSIAQEKDDIYPQDVNKKHEIKLNTFNLIALSSFDIGYEYLINNDSSFGVSLFYNFNDSEDILLREFSLTPYYRWFFSENFTARGFFVEAFGMLNRSGNEASDYYYDNNGNYVYNNQTTKATNFALGISVGGKFITRKNFIAEVYLGVGRNLIKENEDFFDTNIVGRGGISLGYRF
ncbi:hypothetical protein BTO04_12805 [Polaribacter sp. SA4-10]|uniref:DUF3575 domain-containing protein n=1 Tax=Polaribacter sp. SA4-10 TaxID=754397 RepID=UPI000B3CA7FD|nr:DUF3575 domain-containing protein [Polaribacter sp. SA4-10]ARV07515.1 hypothetical protein BTO04_12805 [Polaribacter sp. SA4-10]